MVLCARVWPAEVPGRGGRGSEGWGGESRLAPRRTRPVSPGVEGLEPGSGGKASRAVHAPAILGLPWNHEPGLVPPGAARLSPCRSPRRREKIPLIRRFSGGGTVIVDADTIFTSIIVNQARGEGARTAAPSDPEPLSRGLRQHPPAWGSRVNRRLVGPHRRRWRRESRRGVSLVPATRAKLPPENQAVEASASSPRGRFPSGVDCQEIHRS